MFCREFQVYFTKRPNLACTQGHWRIENNDVSLLFNPCGPVHDLSLPNGCLGALACAKQHSQWNVISRPLRGSSLLESYNAESIESGFRVTYPLENACRLSIDYTCGKSLGKPIPVDTFQADSCNFKLSWETRAACSEKMEPVALSGHSFRDPVRQVFDSRPI